MVRLIRRQTLLLLFYGYYFTPRFLCSFGEGV